jgi:hypothetical protein
MARDCPAAHCVFPNRAYILVCVYRPGAVAKAAPSIGERALDVNKSWSAT